ncbi:MAG: cyclophilin-like fold protein [Micropruina sp.]|uniref:cyclophilin-like fold protein n=1 Tax=Micropruina sp. TaxID=2737536 RepID=UPI0039E30FB8
MRATPIRIAIGDRVLSASLSDNPTARSLVDQLPMTTAFEDYSGQEVIGTPPTPLTMAGMPSGADPEVGDIGYYAPSGVVVLYYADVGYFPGIARIGRIEGDLSAIKGWSGSVRVTIERAD